MTNTVLPGSRYPIGIVAGYQAGYEGAGPFAVQAWVSHEGQTWVELPEGHADPDGRAEFRIHTPHDAEWVTLRVRAADTDGNLVDQSITRAWKVAPSR